MSFCSPFFYRSYRSYRSCFVQSIGNHEFSFPDSEVLEFRGWVTAPVPCRASAPFLSVPIRSNPFSCDLRLVSCDLVISLFLPRGCSRSPDTSSAHKFWVRNSSCIIVHCPDSRFPAFPAGFPGSVPDARS